MYNDERASVGTQLVTRQRHGQDSTLARGNQKNIPKQNFGTRKS